jgi:hypothetical protein
MIACARIELSAFSCADYILILLLQPLHQLLQALQHLWRKLLRGCYAADVDANFASGSWLKQPAQSLWYLRLRVHLGSFGFTLHDYSSYLRDYTAAPYVLGVRCTLRELWAIHGVGGALTKEWTGLMIASTYSERSAFSCADYILILLLQPLHQFLQALQHLRRKLLCPLDAADIDADLAGGGWLEQPAQARRQLPLLWRLLLPLRVPW